MATLMSHRSVRVLSSGRTQCTLTLQRSTRKCKRSEHVGVSGRSRGLMPCQAATGQPSASAPTARHAVLHDFCMCIPYGAISVAVGVALFFLNLTNIASTALVGGATSIAASVLSLQEWRAGGSSKQYTLTAAVSAAAVAYTTAASLDLLKGLPYWLSVALCVVSVTASAFCAYNVLAGGNPPPKGGHKAAASK